MIGHWSWLKRNSSKLNTRTVSNSSPMIAEIPPPVANLPDVLESHESIQMDVLYLRCPFCVAKGRNGLLQTLKVWDRRLQVSNTGRAPDSMHVADLPLICRKCDRVLIFVLSLLPPHIESLRGK
jgi:hypothetical protein